jgi:hypothetical protein
MIKKSVFTISDSWPWLAVLAIVGTCLVKAIGYGASHGFDQTGMAVFIIAATVIVVAAGVRMILRTVWILDWNEAFQTRLGMAIIPINEVRGVPYREIDSLLDDVAFYWRDWATKQTDPIYPEGGCLTVEAAKKLLAAGFDGGTLFVSPTPISTSYGRVIGVTSGNEITVLYDSNVIIDDKALLELVRHEASHLCLTSLGYPAGPGGCSHHKIFASTGYC